MFKYVNILIARIILLADVKDITAHDTFRYIVSIVLQFTPIAFAMRVFNIWFQNNSQFGSFLLWLLIINMVVGGWRHLKFKTFDVWRFFWKNIGLALAVIIVYATLEMLHLTVGRDFARDIFGMFIQVMILIIPISKIWKNIFILSNGKIPPEILMRKLYNFEKNGDLHAFFSDKYQEKDAGYDKMKNNLLNKIKNERDPESR